jgi:hypothetical protein
MSFNGFYEPAMTLKQHKIAFFTFLALCFALELILKPPVRNYIPVVWAVLGFMFHGILYVVTWQQLSALLIDEHESELKRLHMSYITTRKRKIVLITSLLWKRKEIEAISPEIKSLLSRCRVYFILTIIAFIAFPLLGIVMVVMTWR